MLRIGAFDVGADPDGLARAVVPGLPVLVLFGAAYGGTLVFEYGFNVENLDDVWNETEEDHVRPDRRKRSAS